MWFGAAALSLALPFVFRPVGAADLEAAFRAPPDSAKPQVWWHWMAGNVTRAGITADLEAMADVGIGGAILFDAGLGARWGVPEGDLDFNTPDWYDTVRFAAQEAKRLGLELGMANCSGWANSGGPWNTPEYAMKTVCFTATAVTGGTVRVCLPQPEDKVCFYRDIAVVAFPTPREAFEIRDWTFKCFSNPGRKYDVPDTRTAPSAAGTRLFLDLGVVRDFADVTVNGQTFPTLWKPPFRVEVTEAAASGRLRLVVRVTNLWPNRLIGDDFKPEDCTFEPGQPLMARHLNGWPSFVRDGKPSPSGKLTFATWKHWTKDDAPLPSGCSAPCPC